MHRTTSHRTSWPVRLGIALLAMASFALAAVVAIASHDWVLAVRYASPYFAAYYYAFLLYTGAPVLALAVPPCILLWRKRRTRILALAALVGSIAVVFLIVQSVVLHLIELRL